MNDNYDAGCFELIVILFLVVTVIVFCIKYHR